MVTDIREDTNLSLFGDVLVRITRSRDSGHIEIVTHPSPKTSVAFRQAREPYHCTLRLVDGDEINVDLACTEDWGNIQVCYPDECRKWPALGWGNDEDGHREIDFVVGEDGAVIPMAEFERDVQDLIIHHED